MVQRLKYLQACAGKRYWGSGVIFGYWTINQIPNFVLAAPILYVSYFAFFHYIQKTIHQKSYSHKHNRVLNYITSSLGLNYIDVDYTSNLDLAMVAVSISSICSVRVAFIWINVLNCCDGTCSNHKSPQSCF